ncbi:MAG: serine/threonine-protein kinase, partial [Rubripirellula sp.]|nr:serine/threonine-protein kinase [Rubripirellula sp.]
MTSFPPMSRKENDHELGVQKSSDSKFHNQDTRTQKKISEITDPLIGKANPGEGPDSEITLTIDGGTARHPESTVTEHWEGFFSGNSFNETLEQVVDLGNRYKAEKTLGKGGMGEVLLATDLRLKRKVAIKRILVDLLNNETIEKRFLAEARSIAALSHPNVVHLYDYGRSKDGPFLIMEYVEGSNLAEECRQGPMEVEKAIDLTCQLCDGLAKVHAAGIVHRDIKPANVLLTIDGVPKLTDFGLAKDYASDFGMTMTGMVLGTYDYMPPEQRKDASLTDHRSDLWSLAASLYQMITGEKPNVIRTTSVPAQLHQVLDRALQESKDDRYQSAIELRDDLRDCMDSKAVNFSNLDQGQCPGCGTRNDSSRRFCRNPDCAESLSVACLSCSSEINIWDLVCGNCGAKQEELLEHRRKEMAAQRSEAERCVGEHRHNHAIEIAKQLGSENDLRLQHLKIWSDLFVLEVEQERSRELEHAAERLDESLKHEAAFDYPSGIKSLKQIPKAIHMEELPNQTATVATVL